VFDFFFFQSSACKTSDKDHSEHLRKDNMAEVILSSTTQGQECSLSGFAKLNASEQSRKNCLSCAPVTRVLTEGQKSSCSKDTQKGTKDGTGSPLQGTKDENHSQPSEDA